MGLTVFVLGVVILLMLTMAVFLMNGKGSFMIAGYNSMSKREKEKYDQKKLCQFTGLLLIIISVCMIIMFIGIYFSINWLTHFGVALIVVCSTGGAIFMNKSKRLKNDNKEVPEDSIHSKAEKNKTILVVAISIVILVGIGVLFYHGTKEPVINIHQNKIEIKGMYGLSVDISEIRNISLIEKSMREIGIGMRINGFGGIGETLKGHFRSENTGETLLFVQSNSVPTIRIERNNGKDIYLSFRNSQVTLDLYRSFLELGLE